MGYLKGKHLGVIFVLITSGCISTQSGNFKDTSSAYREVVEQYANDNILLNIIRASKDMPMSFLDIPSVVGSGSYTGSVGITPSVTYFSGQSPIDSLGRSLTNTNTTYGGSLGMVVNNSFTFTQTSLDNATFMGKFMEDVAPETIRFYGGQKNLPREAMLLLLIDNIEIRTVDNEEVAWWINDPRSKDYKSFQQFLYLLLEVGLMVEPFTEKHPIGPAISEKQFIANYPSLSDMMKDVNNESGKSLEKIMSKGQTYYQLYKTTTTTRFCINKFKAERLLGNKIGHSSYCNDSSKEPKNYESTHSPEILKQLIRERKIANKELVLRIKLRSTANVFDFLGNTLIAEQQNPSNLVMVTSKDVTTFKPDYDDPPKTIPLFKIYKNGEHKDAISKVTYRSDIYYIKEDDGTYTKSVFEFLSNLLTLSKRINSMPPSPTILVR